MHNSLCVNILKVVATAMVFFCHSWIVCVEAFAYQAHGWYKFFITPAWGGVWMFLIIGGYLAAHGFYEDKYSLTFGGVFKYYINRVVKILIPTYVFISLEYVLIYQDRMIRWEEILILITCTFYGGDTSESIPMPGIGATWYIFFILWLYLLMPLFFFILKKMDNLKILVKHEFSFYFIILMTICFIGMCYRVYTYYYKLDWYYCTYANIFGCMDLFVAGIVTYRLTRCLPGLKIKTLRYLRFGVCVLFCLLIGICVDFGFLLPYVNILYMYIGPSVFLVLSSILLILYAYKTDESKKTAIIVGKLFNNVAPYTFAFYLWHSSILMYVAGQLKIVNDNHHFVMTVIWGIIVTMYISFLMTKMNNALIGSILKLENNIIKSLK